jgi:hypothetical protein
MCVFVTIYATIILQTYLYRLDSLTISFLILSKDAVISKVNFLPAWLLFLSHVKSIRLRNPLANGLFLRNMLYSISNSSLSASPNDISLNVSTVRPLVVIIPEISSTYLFRWSAEYERQSREISAMSATATRWWQPATECTSSFATTRDINLQLATCNHLCHWRYNLKFYLNITHFTVIPHLYRFSLILEREPSPTIAVPVSELHTLHNILSTSNRNTSGR